jgi:hypothetical protein
MRLLRPAMRRLGFGPASTVLSSVFFWRSCRGLSILAKHGVELLIAFDNPFSMPLASIASRASKLSTRERCRQAGASIPEIRKDETFEGYPVGETGESEGLDGQLVGSNFVKRSVERERVLPAVWWIDQWPPVPSGPALGLRPSGRPMVRGGPRAATRLSSRSLLAVLTGGKWPCSTLPRARHAWVMGSGGRTDSAFLGSPARCVVVP